MLALCVGRELNFCTFEITIQNSEAILSSKFACELLLKDLQNSESYKDKSLPSVGPIVFRRLETRGAGLSSQ